jgi:hypothetical protein
MKNVLLNKLYEKLYYETVCRMFVISNAKIYLK